MNLRYASLVFIVAATAGCPADDGDGTGTDGDTDPTTSTSTSTSSTSTSTATSASTSTTTSTTTSSSVTTDATTVGPLTGSESSSGGSDSGSEGSTSTGSTACVGMSFFVTSVGSGEAGGNLGGLDGADGTCQAMAETAGQGKCTWHAYLSTSAEDARDRIGTGPWENAEGAVVAASVQALHDDGLSNGRPQHMLDENGQTVPASEHDILTGSLEDGTYEDGASCADWTSNSSDDDAGVGHSDIPSNPQFSPSWNSAHVVSGCTQGNLQSTNGAGRIYCFAI